MCSHILHESERISIYKTIILSVVPQEIRSRDSAVGIATGYGLDGRGFGVRFPVRLRIFSSPRRPDPF
jgi:hypothetical protein